MTKIIKCNLDAEDPYYVAVDSNGDILAGRTEALRIRFSCPQQAYDFFKEMASAGDRSAQRICKTLQADIAAVKPRYPLMKNEYGHTPSEAAKATAMHLIRSALADESNEVIRDYCVTDSGRHSKAMERDVRRQLAMVHNRILKNSKVDESPLEVD